MTFFDATTFAVGISSLTCLIAKIVCLIWAFIRTKQPAALVYLAFLVVNALSPVVLAYTLSPTNYGSAWLFVGVGSAVIEAILFIWLVQSLLKRSSNAVNLPTDA